MQVEVHLENPAVDTGQRKEGGIKTGAVRHTDGHPQRLETAIDLLPVVPTTAVGKDSAGNYFVNVVKNGETSPRSVVIAFNDAASVGISSGLKLGEKVAKSAAGK